MKDRFQNVTFLVGAKADPNKKTRHGETPLHFAARGNSVESTNILLQAGANPTIVDDEGITAYSVARNLDIKRKIYDWYIANSKKLTDDMKEDFGDISGDDD